MPVPDHIESLEIEYKYAVTRDTQLPDAERFASVGLVLESAHTAPLNLLLQAEYHDTRELDLGGLRVAVRNRAGGKDAGWHLKEKTEDGARELFWPSSIEMSSGLREEISQRIGARADTLTIIGRIRTARTVTRLFLDGVPVIELADDSVDGVNELTGVRQQWREWEAELLVGDPELLDLIDPLLTAAGAKRSRGVSKIERTMRPVRPA